jgi:heterodisulfide reductase subunit B
MAFDDPENPKMLEDFIRALGAEPVVYPYRNECCGGYISLKEPEMAATMSNHIAQSAEGFGAEMLITACPLCRYNLNKSQGNLPVYYFTELLAEALGVKEEAMK